MAKSWPWVLLRLADRTQLEFPTPDFYWRPNCHSPCGPLCERVSPVFAQLDGQIISSSHIQRKSTCSDLRFISEAGEHSLLADFIHMHRLTKVRSFIVLFTHPHTWNTFWSYFPSYDFLVPFLFPPLPSPFTSLIIPFLFSCPFYFSPRAHTWENFSVRKLASFTVMISSSINFLENDIILLLFML